MDTERKSQQSHSFADSLLVLVQADEAFPQELRSEVLRVGTEMDLQMKELRTKKDGGFFSDKEVLAYLEDALKHIPSDPEHKALRTEIQEIIAGLPSSSQGEIKDEIEQLQKDLRTHTARLAGL